MEERNPVQKPLDIVLNCLKGVKPLRSGKPGYIACCPAHNDSNPSLTVWEDTIDGHVGLKCFAGCEHAAILAALNLEKADLYPESKKRSPRSTTGLTLFDLAADKLIDPRLLLNWGITDEYRYKGSEVVRIPYFTMDGQEYSRFRIRTALVAKEGSYWSPSKDPLIPYGLQKLSEARAAKHLVIVEGESDCWTLWRHQFPALGIPGIENTAVLQSEHIEGIENISIVQEPPSKDDVKKGRDPGKKFVSNMQSHLKELGYTGNVSILDFEKLTGTKDPNDLHKKDMKGFKTAFEKALSQDKTSKRKFLYASDVKPEPVNYLWDKRLARGMLTLLVGDPGLGKSMLDTKLIAAITTGGVMPDGKAIEPSGVVLMAPEDSYEHTIVPRLIAAGADLSKVLLLSEVPEKDSEGNVYHRPISFPEDAAILEDAIVDCKASLAIIDPVLAMMNGKYDSHKDQEARIALGRVLTVAKRQQCAVLGIFHLNKQNGGNALYRSSASIAFIAMARIGLFLVPDPDNPENGRVLVNHKNNLAAKAKSLCFTIEQTPDEIGYVQWQGESPYTEEQLLNQATPTNNPKSEQESDLVSVLKANGIAMTPVEIHDKIPMQSLNALEQMLKRKLEQGILMRPARGMYTYNGNPLYTSKKEDVSNVSNVSLQSSNSFVSATVRNETDMKVLKTPCETAQQEAGEQTDITDSKVSISFQSDYYREMEAWLFKAHHPRPMHPCSQGHTDAWWPYWHQGERAWGCAQCRPDLLNHH